jgi:hypothetical protein
VKIVRREQLGLDILCRALFPIGAIHQRRVQPFIQFESTPARSAHHP